MHSDGPSHPIEVSGNIIPEGPPSNNNKNDGMAPVPIINLQVGQMVGGGLDGGAQPPAIMPPSQNGEGKNVLDQQIVEGKQQQVRKEGEIYFGLRLKLIFPSIEIVTFDRKFHPLSTI